ncbi:site-specific integrase [Lacticaseibacillus paracasei]|uniref:site-specific integrase n=1 Tax=Lacticaseibacillus paracasei TaxID=1597 RepID=UPI003C12F927
MKVCSIQGYAARLMELTGIAFYPHLLRHTFAVRLLESGVALTDIQSLLGHKDIALTSDNQYPSSN